METEKIIPPNAVVEQPIVFQNRNSFTEHGNEIEEIISNRPPAIVRWGTVYFLIILLCLGLVCWFIQYPDIVNTRAKLTSINAPKEIVTKTSGKLVKLFAGEGEQATKGTLIGFMESTANHEEVILLSKKIDTMETITGGSNIEQLLPYLHTNWQNLGELQQTYQAFLQSFISFRNYISGGFYLRKKMLLAKDAAFLDQLHSNLLAQKELNTEDLGLSEQTFSANQSLKTDKVISDFDYRNEQSKLIGKKLSLPQINAGLISNEALQNEKSKEIAELENTITQQKSIFSQALNTFKSQINDWKKKYILSAPIEGKISFATFLQENQQLRENQTLCFINPGNTQYYAEVYVPQANLGKVKKGQQVLLKFPAYPFQEYGSVRGQVDFISHIATDSGYIAKVTLPDALHTSYNKQVQFREGLLADGEIITVNMNLLQRFYYNMIKQVSR